MLISAVPVITCDERDRVLDRAWIRTNGATIESISVDPLDPGPGEEVIDGAGLVALPGFINTHTHLFQTLLRGVYEELPLPMYLSYIYRCGLELGPADSWASAALGSIEAVRSGVTTIVDHHFLNRRPDLASSTIEGIAAVGLRSILARTVMDMGDALPPEILETPEEGFEAVDALLRAFASPISARLLGIWTGPNTPGVNASDRCCIATREYAEGRGIRRSAHVAEYLGVVDAVRSRYRVDGPVRWLHEIGALGPDLLAVHAVQVSPAEVDLLAASGAAVSHNPFSNLFCGDRNAPVSSYLARSVPVGLGTDGAANNNAQTILDALRITRLLQRSHPTEPDAISPVASLRMATIEGAQALGIDDIVGSLEPGKRADLLLADIGASAHTVPLHDLLLQVVHSMKPTDVRSVLVDGQWVLRDRELVTTDEAAILHRAQAAASALVTRLG